MIDRVIIKNLKIFKDERGWVAELYRHDEMDFVPAMAYASFSENGAVRGPHEHKKQSDYFCFFGPGDFMMYLWDERKDSSTYGEKMEMRVGESNPLAVLVPPGVVHGYKCVSESGAWYVNLPDALYAGKNKKEAVDEIRHEKDGANSKFKIN
ncbi:MAG: dTDP-4-dehydrorhamnose 3,5-epimerase family protein [Patescibacteria group bacterium]|nr:dTDP-4-dehydrorhamnose 3,5-epimerase family protein [Patescibacteria group bacterium]MDD5490721.1 dTDP-4-dehydrorhamnose 3,5-epimerase family protein [Patescibacteria group bacterium]